MNYKKLRRVACWSKARELCQAVFELTNKGRFKDDFTLRNQAWKGWFDYGQLRRGL